MTMAFLLWNNLQTIGKCLEMRYIHVETIFTASTVIQSVYFFPVLFFQVCCCSISLCIFHLWIIFFANQSTLCSSVFIHHPSWQQEHFREPYDQASMCRSTTVHPFRCESKIPIPICYNESIITSVFLQ